MTINIKKLEKLLKIKMQNIFLLDEALTHKSANLEKNNERFEFLGDRVLGLILAKELIDLYPNKTEGDLDKRFAKLVNRKTCSTIAWKIGLNNFIKKSDPKRKVSEKDEKILSDACEALIGAVYIDRGYEYAKNFVLRLWKKDLDESNVTILDPKTKLQEYSLKLFKKLPVYNLLNIKGPRHNPVFKICVSVNKSKKFVGYGNSKKIAEQDAANNFIKSKNIN
tara:strand:- start:1405 stop:2073 length:669 start_codon:yes stop_codon:yes gene_type:complete